MIISDSNLKDEELVQMVQTGDTHAYFLLLTRYNDYSKSLAGKIISVTPNCKLDFEELRQECLISVETALNSYEFGSSSFFIYWQTIAKNAIYRYIGEQNKNIEKSSLEIKLDETQEGYLSNHELLGEPDVEVDTLIFENEFVKIISEEETGLDAIQKKIMFLYLEAYELKEIAHFLRIPKSTVYRKYHEAIEKIRLRYRITDSDKERL